ncbi:hypothetical protein [Brachyspira sp. G79]|uniref:hypothetical protein n=1 Tax=Brachyspira sp. G79 TaxID=1358104 RepID=UPI000BBC3F58|nr:hypothetical protein [Brachyspira sp. G79]PCG21017.1 hypothetical protein KQ44_01045 [Brachyspira sp. G79]
MADIYVNSRLRESMSLPVGIITDINTINNINNIDISTIDISRINLTVVYIRPVQSICINNIITNSAYRDEHFDPNNFDPNNFIIANRNVPNNLSIDDLDLNSNNSISIIRRAISVNDPNLSYNPANIEFVTGNNNNLNYVEIRINGGAFVGILRYYPQDNHIVIVHNRNTRISYVSM